MRTIFYIVLIPFLTACGGDSGTANSAGTAGSAGAAEQGRFQVSDSLGGGFDHESSRARVRFVTDDMLELSAQGGLVRLHVRGLPASGIGTTSEFLRNNTLYTTTLNLDGAPRQVGCSTADPVVGAFDRTANDGERVSGRFEVEFVACSDYMSGEPVDVPGLPLTVTGIYEDLPLDD